jgi:DNA-binding protein HU-beta
MKTTKINRTELIDALALDTGVSKAQAEKMLNSFVDVVTDHLKKGHEVNITGFGIYRVVERKPRMGINPKTREPMKIGSSVSVAWRVGKTLKEAVRTAKKN